MYTGLILHARNSDDDYVQTFIRGGSWISGKGVHMYKGVGLALLILSLFSYISHENSHENEINLSH